MQINNDILSKEKIGQLNTKLNKECGVTCEYFKDCIDKLTKCDKDSFFHFFLKNIEIHQKYEKIIKDYINTNFENEEAFYLELIGYIKDCFFDKDKLRYIPDNLHLLFDKDRKFRKKIISEINVNLHKIVEDSSINSFEEINFLLFLIGIDKNFDISKEIFIDQDRNFKDIEELLYYYENLIILELEKLEKSKGNLDFSFSEILDVIIVLFNILNKIILFGFTFFQDNDNLFKLLKITKDGIGFLSNLVENNNFLKNQENKKYKDIILTIEGRYALMFSNFFIKIREQNSFLHKKLSGLDLDIKKIDLHSHIFASQINGFKKIKEGNYGNGNTTKELVETAFIGNTSVELLKLIDSVEDKSLLNNEKLNNILQNYKKYINPDFIFSDIDNFKKELILNLFKIYNKSSKLDEKNTDLSIVIDDFIKKESVNDYQIESLKDLIIYSDFDDINKFLELGNFLLLKKRYKSDYHEKFKIDIIMSIFEKIINKSDSVNRDEFIKNLIKYIDSNKISSNLFYSYTEFYLYLSLYYSKKSDFDSQNKAKEYYHKFGQFHSHNTAYFKLIQDVSRNIGINFFKLIGGDISKFDDNFIIKAGQIFIHTYKKTFHQSVKLDINEKIAKINNDALKEGKNSIDEKILDLIRRDLFSGMCKIFISKGKNTFKINKSEESKTIDLEDDYKLVFIYPKIYEEEFDKIFFDEISYLSINIGNAIVANKLKKDLEIEPITEFLNDVKIIKKSQKNKKEKNTLIILRLLNIEEVSQGYGYEFGIEYVKKAAKEIENIFKPLAKGFYKGSGANFGIHLKDGLKQKDIEDVLGNLDKISIKLSNIIDIPLKYKAGISFKEAGDFYIKAIKALSNFASGNKTNYSFFNENLIDTSKHKKTLEVLSLVKKAIEEDRVESFFQPIIDLKSGEIYKYESLVRIISENGDIIPPGAFMPILDELKDSWQITKIVIDKSFRAVSEKKISVSINISGDDLINEKFLDFINEKIFQYDLNNTSNITFEILESHIFGNFKDVLKNLKNMGFKIAMDDYGSDGSTMKRFIELSQSGLLNYLKLDGDIVKPLVRGDGFNTIKGIIEDCHKNDIKVIAEYVENENILNILKLLGVDYGQGWHFSKPLPPDKL